MSKEKQTCLEMFSQPKAKPEILVEEEEKKEILPNRSEDVVIDETSESK